MHVFFMTLGWLTDTVTSDLERALHYTLLWGLEGVELRTVGGPADRVPFVNEAKLTRRLAKQELPVVAIVPGLFQGPAGDRLTWLNELTVLDEVLSFCQRIGTQRVVVSAFAGEPDQQQATEALRRAGEKAAQQDVTLTVLNEPDMACSTGQALARLLDAVDHPAVRAAWRPSSAVQVGEDPRAGLEALAARVELVRCADGIRRGGTWHEQPLGEGAVGWEHQLEQLHRQGFDGPLSLEVNLDPHTRHGLRAARQLIAWRRALAPA